MDESLEEIFYSREYRYDRKNRLNHFADEEGAMTRLFYDKNDRVRKVVRPEQYEEQKDDGIGLSYTYDRTGNISSVWEGGGLIMITEQIKKLLGVSSIPTERTVPGTQLFEGREYCYVSNNSQKDFKKTFDELVDYVSPPIPKDGGVINEACKLTLPNGEIFQAISYRGDIEGWRRQIEQGAKALNEKIAKIETDSIVLDDMQSFRLTDCRIDFD